MQYHTVLFGIMYMWLVGLFINTFSGDFNIFGKFRMCDDGTLNSLSCLFLYLLDIFFRWTIQTAIDKRTVVAVLFPVQEQSFKAVGEATLLICETAAAIAGEIWVLVWECMTVFARIVFKSTLRLCGFQFSGTHYRVIGSLQWAFAVPTVSRVMVVPERVIDGQRELHAPVGSVCAFRLWWRGWHPSEVWEDVFVPFKLLPVSSCMCTDYSGVILCLQPCTHLFQQGNRRDRYFILSYYLRPHHDALPVDGHWQWRIIIWTRPCRSIKQKKYVDLVPKSSKSK